MKIFWFEFISINFDVVMGIRVKNMAEIMLRSLFIGSFYLKNEYVAYVLFLQLKSL